ncbi:MAG: MoaD/ThiS family protein [Arcobacteraceae bacterium]|jgi:molybdopterin synthase sulfur carrier subunit|nr:MoaD/ThiS family protein [Arcobacteraceae bacterium]
MVTIEFLGPIGIAPMSLEISSLEQLSDILKEDERLQNWLENSAVAINDILVKDKTITLKDGDKVSLLPPVCGG